MRIVLASMGAEEFAQLHAACKTAGHQPVAYAYSRSMRPRQPADTYAVSKLTGIIKAAPTNVDLLLPADPAGLAASLVGHRPDLLVLYGFNWILPREVYELPTFGTVNIHPSMLPQYRGPAPVHWAIRNGDPETGVTVHRVDDGVDTGPILAQRGGVPLGEDVSRARVHAQLAPVVTEALTTALARVAAGEPGEPQPAPVGPRAGFLEPGFSQVDWSHSARQIHQQVRVFQYIGSETAPMAQVGGRWSRLIRTSLTPAGGLRVECGDGPIWIIESAPAEPPATELG